MSLSPGRLVCRVHLCRPPDPFAKCCRRHERRPKPQPCHRRDRTPACKSWFFFGREYRCAFPISADPVSGCGRIGLVGSRLPCDVIPAGFATDAKALNGAGTRYSISCKGKNQVPSTRSTSARCAPLGAVVAGSMGSALRIRSLRRLFPMRPASARALAGAVAGGRGVTTGGRLRVAGKGMVRARCAHWSATGSDRPPTRAVWFGKILASFAGCADFSWAGA